MKTYQKPEAELVMFTTESITIDTEVGTGGSNDIEFEG